MLKDIFKNDVGEYNPKAEKLGIKTFLYVIIGFGFSVFIPIFLIYLEAWEFTLNLENLWNNNNLRFYYYLVFVMANISLTILSLFTPYRINGKYYRLKYKKALRIISLLLYIIAMVLYIIANIIY